MNNVEVSKFNGKLLLLPSITSGYKIMFNDTRPYYILRLYDLIINEIVKEERLEYAEKETEHFLYSFNARWCVFYQKENNKIGVIFSNKKLLNLLAEKFNFTLEYEEHEKIESIIYYVLSKHFSCLITETLMDQIKEELVKLLNKNKIHVLNKDVAFAVDRSAVYIRNKKYAISF